MKKTLFNRLIGLVALTALCQVKSLAANIEVSGVQLYIGGANSNVSGSGTPDNYDTTTTTNGSFAVFDMQKDGADFADLRVTYSGGASNQVMVNRTSNSQTLTDSGTISILLNVSASGGYAGSFKFDWFGPGSFINGEFQDGSLISNPILYTTFDIDFNQLVAVKTNQLQQYGLSTNTLLTADLGQTPGYISFEDSGANSTFNDPKTAAQFLTRSGPASHDLLMGKQSTNGPSLFMFEFRDPSQIIADSFVTVAIPEPAALSMSLAVFAFGFWTRRRFVS